MVSVTLTNAPVACRVFHGDDKLFHLHRVRLFGGRGGQCPSGRINNEPQDEAQHGHGQAEQERREAQVSRDTKAQ
jgi:hypothetical protein